jgi:hypothetical protein
MIHQTQTSSDQPPTNNKALACGFADDDDDMKNLGDEIAKLTPRKAREVSRYITWKMRRGTGKA